MVLPPYSNSDKILLSLEMTEVEESTPILSKPRTSGVSAMPLSRLDEFARCSWFGEHGSGILQLCGLQKKETLAEFAFGGRPDAESDSLLFRSSPCLRELERSGWLARPARTKWTIGPADLVNSAADHGVPEEGRKRHFVRHPYCAKRQAHVGARHQCAAVRGAGCCQGIPETAHQ